MLRNLFDKIEQGLQFVLASHQFLKFFNRVDLAKFVVAQVLQNFEDFSEIRILIILIGFDDGVGTDLVQPDLMSHEHMAAAPHRQFLLGFVEHFRVQDFDHLLLVVGLLLYQHLVIFNLQLLLLLLLRVGQDLPFLALARSRTLVYCLSLRIEHFLKAAHIAHDSLFGCLNLVRLTLLLVNMALIKLSIRALLITIMNLLYDLPYSIKVWPRQLL